LWGRVLTQSAEQFAPIEESLQREISELRQELEKYKSNNQRWQTLFNQWQQEKTQFTNEKITLEQALVFAHKENSSLHIKHDALVMQSQEKQEHITELHRLHNQAQTNLEHYRESSREQRLIEQQRYEQHQQHLEQTISQLRDKLTSVTQDRSLLQQQCEKITIENTAFKIELKELKNQLNNLQEKYSFTERELIESIQAKNHMESQFQEIQKKLDDKAVSFVELQKENAILSHQLSLAQNQVRELNDQNKSLALEKWELGQEKSQLEGQLKEVDRFIKNSKGVMIA
jgi:chromosome segregation ATPase